MLETNEDRIDRVDGYISQGIDSEISFGSRHTLVWSFRCIIFVLFITLFSFTARANTESVLIINSFSDDSPWTQTVIEPVRNFLFQHHDLHFVEENLNCIFIETEEAYHKRVDLIIEKYKNAKLDAIILIGGFALNMRDDIRRTWGDVPIMLLNRSNRYAPMNYYLSGFDGPSDWSEQPFISDLQKDYNLTLIQLPDRYNEVVELMVKLFPKADTFVFISDGIYFNRALNVYISDLIHDAYPYLNYKWMQVDEQRVEDCEDFMRFNVPNVVSLISTWRYKVSDDSGAESIITSEKSFITNARNPIFSLRQTYMSAGAIGGVFNDRAQIYDLVTEDLDLIFKGIQPRDIPMKCVTKTETLLNYPQLVSYHVNTERCPDNTIFIDKPVTRWEKYRHAVILISTILPLVLIVIMFCIIYQTRWVRSRKSHDSLIKNLPLPYAKALICYDKKGKVLGIKYNKNRINSLFLKLVKDNTPHNSIEDLLPNKLLQSIASRILTTEKAINFPEYFPVTDSSYMFSVCRVDRSLGNSALQYFDIEDKDAGNVAVAEVDIFAYDITELRHTGMQLRRTVNILDVTLQVATIVPWQWYIDEGRLIWDSDYLKSDRYHHILDNPVWTSKGFSEDLLFSSVHPDDRYILKDMLNNYKNGTISQHTCELRIIFSSGKEKTTEWVELKSMLMRMEDEDNKRVLFGSLLFITDRKNQETALIEANKRALESDRMKSEFLASMSHEIRTPLNAITGFSELLIETSDVDLRREFVSLVRSNSNMLINNVNDVLDLAKIESNSLDYYKHDFDLNELIDTVGETMIPQIPENIAFNSIKARIQCWINTDETRLRQVLIRLIYNAIKFTKEGTITFGYEIIDDNVRFFVRDTGIGIRPEFHQVIFERFKKLDTFSQGTGIGLTIDREIIRGLGGEIGVISEGEGKGSEFWFSIPYLPVEPSERGTPFF